MSEIQELEHITDLLRANEKIGSLRSLLNDAVAALEEAAEALDNYADAEINEVGHSVGNAAMRAYMEVHDTLASIKRVLPPPPAQEGIE